MLHYVYSWFDKVSKCHLPVISDSAPVANLVETYHREIYKIISDEKTVNNLKDKNLVLVGTFDDVTGVITPCHEVILDMDNLILNAVSAGGSD